MAGLHNQRFFPGGGAVVFTGKRDAAAAETAEAGSKRYFKPIGVAVELTVGVLVSSLFLVGIQILRSADLPGPSALRFFYRQYIPLVFLSNFIRLVYIFAFMAFG